MRRVCCSFLWLTMLWPLAAAGQSAPEKPTQAGGVAASGAQFRLIRSISGSKGSPQGGRFAMEDPRSVFYVPEDRQVIVYMEWDGPPGKHHIEGFWKNPEGKVSALSDFQYEAKQNRFGAYWTLALSESAQVGTWSLEARVAGEPAGSHSFQILAGARPADAVPTRRMLKPAELYERALNTQVTINKYDARGEGFGQASGFLVSPGWIVTAFEAIDGASKLRITFPDGHAMETDQVIAWNRREDWAVLRPGGSRMPLLEQAAADSWSVGDAASFLEAAPEGNRVIANASIDGKSRFPMAGPRLNISSAPTAHAIGSALLNEYGEVIGIVGGSVIPGASALSLLQINAPVARAGSSVFLRGGLAVPINAVRLPAATASPTPLQTLASRGEFLPLVTASRNVSYGQLAKAVESKGGLRWPVEGGDVFSRQSPKMVVYVLWEGREKAKGIVTMRIYDLDNRMLNNPNAGKPVKLNLKSGDRYVTSWDVKVSALPPGVYRVDVWLNDAAAWRTFFRVTD